MGWDKPKPNGYGGNKMTRNDRGQNESLHGKNVKGGRIHGDHVHFHKDGVTVTKQSKKYTISQIYCSRCQRKTAHRVSHGTSYCSCCESHLSSFPKWT